MSITDLRALHNFLMSLLLYFWRCKILVIHSTVLTRRDDDDDDDDVDDDTVTISYLELRNNTKN